jgi:osmotically-inducible protein OsmY
MEDQAQTPCGTPQVVRDDVLRSEIVQRLRQEAQIDARHVSVAVEGCRVTLTGSVPDRHTWQAIEDLAEAAPGVQDVDNRLRIESH